MIKDQALMKDCTSSNYLVPMVGRKQFLLSMENLATLKFHPSLFRYIICFSIIYVESPAPAYGELHMGTFPGPFTSFQLHYCFVEGSFGDAKFKYDRRLQKVSRRV
jgi:hypothetical protein